MGYGNKRASVPIFEYKLPPSTIYNFNKSNNVITIPHQICKPNNKTIFIIKIDKNMRKIDNLNQKALEYHKSYPQGKLSIRPTKSMRGVKDLALAYSPGVAAPCREIEKDPSTIYDYTSKGNLVAVITNGTAVLGLGNIGAAASKPVMEGKAVLFKKLSGIDSFDIEISNNNVDEIVNIISSISVTFGGINLEDIKAPECFEIERRLIEKCDIPIMHDDQHGTAIVSSAGLLNGLEVAGKSIGDIKIVVNGAGAAATACSELYFHLGVKKENLVMCDSKGVIRADRSDLTDEKRRFATTRDINTLSEAISGADMFLGLSKKDVLSEEMLLTMADNPIVFALSNPDPEIAYEKAMACRSDIILATGRSDYPNQINNVLGFPYIFRGALDTRSKKINIEMKIAAVKAIAALAKEPMTDSLKKIYCIDEIHFGREYIIPEPLDSRLLIDVSVAVAKAAIESGVATKIIEDWDAYKTHLSGLVSH